MLPDTPAPPETAKETPQPGRGDPPRAGTTPDAKIDLQALAEKVYELMKQEARLERERRY
jgi:hypothetical protein